MDDSVSTYVDHYLKQVDGLYFLLITLGVLLAIMDILYLYAGIGAGKRTGKARSYYVQSRFEALADRFFELIISGGAILFFLAVYYLINRFYDGQPLRDIWDKYRDFFLLLLIVISILLGRLIDNALIRLKYISHEEKGAVRLVSMVYMMLIFGYIKFIYENDNYDMFITYFLGLMIGRFVYFDIAWEDLKSGICGAVRNLPIMIVALGYLGALCYYGFGNGYLVKHIGVITNVFFVHVFMTVSIGIVVYSYRIIKLIRTKGRN